MSMPVEMMHCGPVLLDCRHTGLLLRSEYLTIAKLKETTIMYCGTGLLTIGRGGALEMEGVQVLKCRKGFLYLGETSSFRWVSVLFIARVSICMFARDIHHMNGTVVHLAAIHDVQVCAGWYV